jgi:hypothetical protein
MFCSMDIVFAVRELRRTGQDRRRALVPIALVCVVAALSLALAQPASAAQPLAPAPLSQTALRPISTSAFGNGVFGRWRDDEFGLPGYDYTIDEQRDPRAINSELVGDSNFADPTDAWHLVGNSRIAGFGVNHGYSMLFSMGDEPEYANLYDATTNHYGGGYGYLHLNGQVISTMTDDAPPGAHTTRRFGVGYYRRTLVWRGLSVDERVYAPFDGAPVLRHDVTLTNRTKRTLNPSWWEYWDVNPHSIGGEGVLGGQRVARGLESPRYDASTHTLSVAQRPDSMDSWTPSPESIFLSALGPRVRGYETDANVFFGSGSRAAPNAVAQERAQDSGAAPSAYQSTGNAMFALRSPVRLRPGASVTLRYAYGETQPRAIKPLVHRLRAVRHPFPSSERAWFRYLPHVSIPGKDKWTAREIAWHAYATRALTLWEGFCGEHVLDEGGNYIFGAGENVGGAGGYLAGAMAYEDPKFARETLKFWAHQQDSSVGQLYDSSGANCAYSLGPPQENVLDLAFLNGVVQYVEASRDFKFLKEKVRWRGGGKAPLWAHIRLAYQHMEQSIGRGPHGEYSTARPATGDFTDLARPLFGMTESMHATALGAFVYPLLASIAKAHGHSSFAKSLRASGRQDLDVVRGQWMGRWYARGYAGSTPMGYGALDVVPQGWAMLAGAPDRSQAKAFVQSYKRFILGIGAPSSLGGPSHFGAPIGPASADPDVTERSSAPVSGSAAVDYPGVWWEVNGPLIWGFSRLDQTLGDRFHRFVWRLYKLNTMGAHAAAFPDHWDGTTSLDDTCVPWYGGGTSSFISRTNPGECGFGTPQILGWNNFSHGFMSWDADNLAGIQATASGWIIHPRLPFRGYVFRTPRIGVAVARGEIRGYMTPERAGVVKLEVVIPKGVGGSVQAWVGSEQVQSRRRGHDVVFHVPLRAGKPRDWAVRWG